MNDWIEKETCISEIENLLQNGYEVEVSSADGFVPVSLFVDKGEWDEYLFTSKRGDVRCNENHLFQTSEGWKYAKDMLEGRWWVLTDTGYCTMATVHKTNKKIPIVDIQVDHENHRYYTNGISSHNTGVGKSLFMCHVAAGCLSQGHNVLYITLEMAEEKIAERIDANLLNIDINELQTISKPDYERKFEALKSKTHGKLIIKEYPTAAASTLHFRALLNELALKKNFRPEIIFVDYLNICASARIKAGGNVNSYTYVKAIAEELRGLAVEYNLPIVSATQTTRSGFTNSDPGLEDTSESFGLPATADFMFALVTNEDLEALNQILVKQLKNRYSDPSYFKRFVVGIDKPKMRLYDTEQSAQDDILDSGQENIPDKPLNTFGNRESKFNRNFSGLKV
jgi:hypothetical protein